MKGASESYNPFYFFVSKTTYNIRGYSYIPIDVISRNTNRVEPLIYKDSIILSLRLELDRLRPQLASLDALS